jgi:menaquinone-dependent protoporphyrinogen oxidase
MTQRILVTYASATGSTEGIAQEIAKTLNAQGLQTEARPMQEVNDLSPYDAIVAGSAIRDKQWLPEAMDWLRTHQAALRQKPFAAFLVCITLAMGNGKYREQVAEWMQPVREVAPPASEGLFAGVLYLDRVEYRMARWGFRLAIWTGFMKEGDHRDWEAIRAWATELPAKLV